MQKRHILYTFIIFIASITTAEAQLSYNPWTNPNDEETIAKFYEKLAKKQQEDSIEYYEPEDPTEIDKTAAYIEVPQDEDEDDSGILNKVSHIFTPKKEPVLIPNTEENRQAVYDMQNQEQDEESGLLDSGSEMLNSLGFDKMKNSIKRKIPKINTNGIIHKFEKASGVNFKSLARKIKR